MIKTQQYHPEADHISLDLETASLEPNAAIVQLAAVNIVTGAEFNHYIALGSCEAVGLDVSKGAMEWWDKQDPELRKRVFGGTHALVDVLIAFKGWCANQCGGDFERLYFWANGPEFDCVILKSAYEACGIEYPFEFRNQDSFRTLMRTCGEVWQTNRIHEYLEAAPNFRKHDAIWDARIQGHLIQLGLMAHGLLPLP